METKLAQAQSSGNNFISKKQKNRHSNDMTVQIRYIYWEDVFLQHKEVSLFHDKQTIMTILLNLDISKQKLIYIVNDEISEKENAKCRKENVWLILREHLAFSTGK